MCPSYYGPDSIPALNGLTPRLHYAANAPFFGSSSIVGYDPMSLNYSVYGNADVDLASDYSLGYGVGSYYAPGMGAGASAGYPMGFNYNQDAMFEQMDKWTDFMYDRNVKYIEKSRANNMRVNGAMDAARYAADALSEKIKKNNQEHIMEAFNKYKAAVREIYPEYASLSDKELSAKAMDLYQQRTGVSLKDQIRAEGNPVVGQGFLNGLTLFQGYKGSSEETIAEMSGLPMDRGDKIWHSIGQGAGLGTTVGSAIIVGDTLLKKIGWIAKGAKSAPALAIGIVTAIGTAILGYVNKD